MGLMKMKKGENFNERRIVRKKSCFLNETLRRFNMKHIHLLLTFNKETRNYIFF